MKLLPKISAPLKILYSSYKGILKDKRGFIKLTRKTLVSIFAFWIIIVGSGLLYMFNPWVKSVEAVWYDDNWGYRKAITVTVTSSASDISNLDTLITVDTSEATLGAGNLQASCQDLRFTNVNGGLLPYYIDSGCATSSTKIWVRADLVPKNTTTYLMYMYYGHPSAPAGTDSGGFWRVRGLIGYWKMEDASGNVTDSSVNGLTMTNTGSTSTTGQYGNARAFNGSSQYMQNTSATLDVSNNFTWSSWVYITSLPAAQGEIFSNAFQWDTGPRLAITPTGAITYSYHNASDVKGYYNSTTTTLSTTTWYHVVWTLENNTPKIYINGSVAAVGTENSANSSSVTYNDFQIGVEKNSATYRYHLTGSIDDARFYNRAMNPTEVSELYSSPGTITTAAVGTSTPSTAFGSAEKAPSPVAYWKFDDGTGTNAQDSTVNNNDGTLTNGPTWQTEDQCVSGKCLYFDGSDDFVSAADSNSLDVGDIFTVQAWVKRNSSGAVHQIFNRTTAGSLILAFVANDKLELGSHNVATIVQSTTTVTDKNWHFVTATKSGSTVKLYIDGKEVTGTVNNATMTTGSDAFVIGKNPTGAGSEFFPGFIDEPKIYNYARSAAQVQADYNARASGEGASAVLGMDSGQARMTLSNGLVGYWKMDESSANTCTGGVNDSCDSSGNGNNGAWNGNATSAAGKYGNAVTLDGTGDYVRIEDATPLKPTAAVTVAAWINTSNVNNQYQQIIAKSTGSGNGVNYELRFSNTTGRVEFLVYTSTGLYTATGSTTLTNNAWYHVGGTYDGTSIRIFVNGAQDGITSASGTLTTNTEPVGIGIRALVSNGGQYPFIGKIDEARIYNRALSSNEVSQLYNFAPGPVAQLKMEEGSGTSTNDSSGNSRTGTMNGNPIWSTGKYGTGVKMDGTGDNISVGDF